MESSDKKGWEKAAPIGVLAGLPTAMFLQVGFINTLRQRGEHVRPSRFGVIPPGIGFAVARDCVYWGATQKQVQTTEPTWAEELTCQFCVCVVPLVCDTLSVRVVEPSWKWPKTIGANLSAACPPVALLGRATWIPVYNWAYVRAQQVIGTTTVVHEVVGLCVGSLAASVVAYPLFMFKTNLVLQQGEGSAFNPREMVSVVRRAAAKTLGVPTFAHLRSVALTTTFAKVFAGVWPHTLANLGPDVACMAAARQVYNLARPDLLSNFEPVAVKGEK